MEPQPPQQGASLHVQWPAWLITLGAWIWHAVGWVVSSIIVGGFLIGILVSYAITGSFGFPSLDPRSWFLGKPLFEHPLLSFFSGIALIVLLSVCYLAAQEQRRSQARQQHEREELRERERTSALQAVEHLLQNPRTATLPSPEISHRRILSGPPLSDPTVIQQRADLVEKLRALLTSPNTNAVVLTGMGGIGKSTLAALLFAHVEREQTSGTSFFEAPSLWLSIGQTITFADLLGTLCEALLAPLPDLAALSPFSQALALYDLLAQQAQSRLIVLDQFEEFLELESGVARTDRPGVGEWLDLLNNRPWPGGIRFLLTSRPRPRGTRIYASASLRDLQVEGLSEIEGMELLRTRGIQAAEQELRTAVRHCLGHALSLTLLTTLVLEYRFSLPHLLHNVSLWEGEIADNLLDKIFQQLSPAVRATLIACSIYRTSVPLTAIEKLLEPVLVPALPSALKILLTQYLIQPVGEDHYQVHRIIASYAQWQIVPEDRTANSQELQNRHVQAAEYYLDLAETLCPPRERRRRVSDVAPFLEAVWHLLEASQGELAYNLMESEGLFADVERWGGDAVLLEICQLMLPQIRQLQDRRKTSMVLFYLANVQRTQGKIQASLSHYEEALRVSREGGDLEGEGRALNNLGLFAQAQGNVREAQAYYEEALRINREIGDREGEGRALNNLGFLASDQGRREEALNYYEEALRINREVGDRMGEGTTLNNLGQLSSALKQGQEALAYYQAALEIRREVGDRAGEGTTLNNLGLLSTLLGRREEALSYYKEGLQIFREIGNLRGEERMLNNLGGVSNELGRNQASLDYYKEALRLNRELEDLRGEGRILNNLGSVSDDMGRYEDALNYYKEALRIRREIQDRKTVGRTLNNLGRVLAALGRRREALDYYEEALWIAREEGDRSGEGSTLLNLGGVFVEMEQFSAGFAAVLLAHSILAPTQSKYAVAAQSWLDGRKKEIGADTFAALRAEIEPQAAHLVDAALQRLRAS